MANRYWIKTKTHTRHNKGHQTGLTFEDVVKLIAEEGILKVQWIKHHDKSPTDKGQLSGAQMLRLWQAVAKDLKKKEKQKA